MSNSRRWMIFLLISALVIKMFSLSPYWVETYYSRGLYPVIAAVQRILLGWIPFSVGDIVYGLVVLWLIRQLRRLVRNIRQKKAGRDYLYRVLRRTLAATLLVYVVFNFLWGLNYNRSAMAAQMQLPELSYSEEDLVAVTRELAARVNTLRPGALASRDSLKKKRILFRQAVTAYRDLSVSEPLFGYSFPSVKPSLYSYLGNYLGFTGYYNPFTGEAQVNTTVPGFIRPFIACHEIGHQLGYAKESEANFAGYLAARVSADTAVLYSVYFDLFSYASRYLRRADSVAMKTIYEQLDEGVKKDILELRSFFMRYASPVERVIDRIYARYLVANEQPSGKMSYNEVVGLLIAYYRKHGQL